MEEYMDRYEFLDAIKLGFTPDRDFYLKVYQIDLAHPGFRDLALNQLNRIGWPDPWREFAEIVTEYEAEQYAKYLNDAKEEDQNAEYESVG